MHSMWWKHMAMHFPIMLKLLMKMKRRRNRSRYPLPETMCNMRNSKMPKPEKGFIFPPCLIQFPIMLTYWPSYGAHHGQAFCSIAPSSTCWECRPKLWNALFVCQLLWIHFDWSHGCFTLFQSWSLMTDWRDIWPRFCIIMLHTFLLIHGIAYQTLCATQRIIKTRETNHLTDQITA